MKAVSVCQANMALKVHPLSFKKVEHNTIMAAICGPLDPTGTGCLALQDSMIHALTCYNKDCKTCPFCMPTTLQCAVCTVPK